MRQSRPVRLPCPDIMEGDGIERVIRLAHMQEAAEDQAAHRQGVAPGDCPHCALAPALRRLRGVAGITTLIDAACDARQQGHALRLLDENLMYGLLLACDELGDAAERDLVALSRGRYGRLDRRRPC